MTTTTASAFQTFRGSPIAQGRRIGTVTLAADHDFTQSYESACNSHTVHAEAGATAELRCNGYYVMATFTGTVTSSTIVNSLMGHQSAHINEMVGQTRTYTLHMDDTQAIPQILAGTFLGGATVRLDDDVQVIVSQFDHGERGLKFHHHFAIPA